LGLKPVPGYTKITVKKNKAVLFVIENPDVYKSPSNDTTWVIFGEAKVEDASNEAIKRTMANLQTEKATKPQETVADDEMPELVDTEEPASSDEVLDAESEKHIAAILEQVPGTSRARAIQELKAHNNDVVSTIMALSLQ